MDDDPWEHFLSLRNRNIPRSYRIGLSIPYIRLSARRFLGRRRQAMATDAERISRLWPRSATARNIYPRRYVGRVQGRKGPATRMSAPALSGGPYGRLDVTEWYSIGHSNVTVQETNLVAGPMAMSSMTSRITCSTGG